MQNLLNKYPSAKLVVPGHGKIGTINLLNHTLTLAVEINNDKAMSERERKQ